MPLGGHQAMKVAFSRLGLSSSTQSDEWCQRALKEYGSSHSGTIHAVAFEDIVKQTYRHHRKRRASETEQKVRKTGSGARPKPQTPAAAATGTPIQRRAQSVPSVELRSAIIYPNHKRGRWELMRDYEFKGVIGGGNFGKVQSVIHRKTGQKRACKTILIHWPSQRQLIEQEIETLKALDHPNILRLHETYDDGCTIFLIMELCEGGMLYDRIVRHYDHLKRPITEEQVAFWMKQILSASKFCHEREIVHRDIKPDNIILVDESDNSDIKVIDFGLSSTFNKLKQTRREVRTAPRTSFSRVLSKLRSKRYQMEVAGTAHFMAPEMIQGDYTEKCDIFSIGIIMYQLLSGVHPFFIPHVDNEESVKNKIRKEKASVSTPAWACVSSYARDLTSRMLDKNPSRRLSAAEALTHQWFKIMDKPRSGFKSTLTHSVFEGLQSWQNENRLKQAFLKLIAKGLSENEIYDLRQKFKILDKTGDGRITIDELRHCMIRSGYKIDECELQAICDSLTSSGSSFLSYNEFIAALLSKRMVIQEARLREIFDKFDVERRGFITLESVKAAVKDQTYDGGLNVGELEQIFREVDKDCDGRVDFIDFMDLMSS
eukprot:Selendium_serpulae@DN5296_c0_g1_i1.p1